MGLNLAERIRNVQSRFEKAKAKAHGMTVPELRKHLAKRKAEQRAYRAELRRAEQEEKKKFEKWKIEQKYKQKRKQVKSGKKTGFTGMVELLGGTESSSGKKQGSYDPFGVFGSTTKRKPKKRKKKRKRKK